MFAGRKQMPKVIASPGMASDDADIVSTSFKPSPLALMGVWAGLPRRS